MSILQAVLILGAAIAVARGDTLTCSPTGNEIVTANGEQSRNGQFPYHVLVEATYPEGPRFCSGALVSDKFVLTLAQCVQDASEVQVTLGATCLLAGGDNEFRYTFTALAVLINSNFIEETYENDVAMIKFTEEQVKLPPWIAPVALPKSNEQHVDAEVITSGYGLLNFQTSTAADSLQHLTLRVHSYEQCLEEFSFAMQGTGRFCAQRLEQTANCVSDLGSPLVFKGFGYNEYTLLGLTSFGQESACESGHAVGLQEVRIHRRWIDMILEQMSGTVGERS